MERIHAKRFIVALSLAATLMLLVVAQPAKATPGVNAGVLICHGVPNSRVYLLIFSSEEIECVFDTPRGAEHYKGKTGIGLGVDLTLRSDSYLAFTVLMASTDVAIGSYSLQGRYFGGKGSVALGAGFGVGALVGAGPSNVALVPLAFETSTGVGAAGGLAYLFLEPDPEKDHAHAGAP